MSTRERRPLRFRLPPVAVSFTGREDELAAIDEALGVTDRAVITQAIVGLGGVGKTQLAARYVESVTADFDIVAWIHAQDGGIADLAQLAAELGQPVNGLSPRDRAKRALDLLSNTDESWLLALDNVESPEQLALLLPRSGHGRVLVTSRNQSLSQYAPVLSLAVFSEDTAAAYLAAAPDARTTSGPLAPSLARLAACLWR